VGLNVSMAAQFFLTTAGYMGIGPSQMRVDDEICLLFAGIPLYVIRPRQDHFQLVCDCYVHGLMHGELIEIWEDGLFKDEWIDLR
jgi:hypothetical protein